MPSYECKLMKHEKSFNKPTRTHHPIDIKNSNHFYSIWEAHPNT